MTASNKLPQSLTSVRKIVSPDSLRRELSNIRSAATIRPTVTLATGRFDPLNLGHVSLLERAAALGQILVVGVYSGWSFPKSPVQDGETRTRMVAALGCVDFVIQIDDVMEERLVKAVAPDALVVGGDKMEDAHIAGADFVQKRGGHVVVLGEVQVDNMSNAGMMESILTIGDNLTKETF